MSKFLKGHIKYLAQPLQPAKCIAKEQKNDHETYTRKSMDLPPTVGQKKKIDE